MPRNRTLAALAILASLSRAGAATTYSVNSTLDAGDAAIDGICDDGAGHCTLRAALQEVNAGAGGDTVAFAISGTIAPATALPAISQPNTTVDGTGQTVVIQGNGSFPGIVLAATGIDVRALQLTGFTGTDAVRVTAGASGCTLRDLVIGLSGTGIAIASGTTTVWGCRIGTNAAGTAAAGNVYGILISGGAFNSIGSTNPTFRNVVSGNTVGISIGAGATFGTVSGNYVGTDVTGSAAIPNATGINVVGWNWTIGGTAAGAGNVVSGNQQAGIRITGAHFTTVQGNLVGLEANGSTALGDGLYGIEVQTGAQFNTIGGSAAGARNVVSGVNSAGSGFGIFVTDAGTSATVVQGNYVGTDVTGLLPRGNDAGIGVDATSTTIGGTGAGEGNVVSGNGVGIALQGGSTATVQGNRIGVGADGTTPVANLSDGVYIWFNSVGNTVGGTAAFAGNEIAFNTSAGVNIYPGGAATGNSILGNSIHDNGYIPIDLGNNGPTANDPCDADTGPNGVQNYPVITAAFSAGGTTTVNGTLDSMANLSYRIEVFASPTLDANGNGQGKTFLGFATAATDGSCHATWSLVVPGTYVTQKIAATATDWQNSTSEFGPAFTATPVELLRFAAD